MKKLRVIFMLAMMFTVLTPTSALAAEVEPVVETESTPTIAPRADLIGWRYKDVNGVAWKRLYNYSKGTWIGEWKVA